MPTSSSRSRSSNEPRRSGVISVRVSDEEEELLRREAARRGATVSELLRSAVVSLVRPSAPLSLRTTATSVSGLTLEYADNGCVVPRSTPPPAPELTPRS